MLKKNNKIQFNFLSENKKDIAINEIIRFFEEEKDEKIGIISAGVILDFFLESIAKDIYEKGVLDSKLVLKKRFEDIELDLDLLTN